MNKPWFEDVNAIVRYGPLPAQELKFVEKGWGWEQWLANSSLYCLKYMFLKKDKKCSWHYHNMKVETFFVISGVMLMEYSFSDNLEKADWCYLKANDVFHIRTGLRHRFTGLEKTFFIETSTQHFDSDSIRLIPGD